jgi:hypothetical protein
LLSVNAAGGDASCDLLPTLRRTGGVVPADADADSGEL